MRSAMLVLALISYATLVAGHAKLNQPTAWNPNPSTGAPCGGGADPGVSRATWPVGTTVDSGVIWQVVAGDGVGAITVKVDQAGGTKFTKVIPISGSTPTDVGVAYPFDLTIPTDIICTGAGGLCTVQVSNGGGWTACSTVEIPGGSVPPVVAEPGQPYCANLTGLSFCSELNGHTGFLNYGTNAIDVDATLMDTYQATLYNPNVFGAPAADGCGPAYKAFMCAATFPSCDLAKNQQTDHPCNRVCHFAVNTCNLLPSHKTLYTCDTFASEVLKDNFGPCDAEFTGQSTVPPPSGLDDNGAAHVTIPVALFALLALLF